MIVIVRCCQCRHEAYIELDRIEDGWRLLGACTRCGKETERE